MRKDEFVMRGQTPSISGANTEVLNFSGFKPGYAYKLTEFKLFPSTDLSTDNYILVGAITAGKSPVDPVNPNFNDDSLIANVMIVASNASLDGHIVLDVINDTFMITQNLKLTVSNTLTNEAVNWQCKFKPVKLAKAEEAVANYKQYMISDGS